MKVAITKLTQLGLSEYEARAYIAVLKENPLTAYEIAKSSDIPSSKIYEVIRKLENRQMVQAVHGEGSKIYVPASLDEVLQNFRSSVENSLSAIKQELKDIKIGMDISYTWHINDYDGLILKAERMLKTADTTVLLLIWPPEITFLLETLKGANERGVKTATIHYGATSIKIKQMYLHPVADTIYENREARGFSLVADSREALIGNITGIKTEAIWSMNRAFVAMAEDYIKHDIYFLKTARRFDLSMQKVFGPRYEKLVDVFSDDE